MALLVTVTQLADYMDTEFSNRQTDAADFVLDGLEGELSVYLGRPVSIQTFVETHVVPAHHVATRYGSFFGGGENTTGSPGYREVLENYILYPNNTPIDSVASITVRSQGTLVGNATTLLAETDYFVKAWGVEVPSATGNNILTITYAAGLPTTNAGLLRHMILRAASREMTNMHDDTVGMKDLEVRNAPAQTTGFTDAELRGVKRLRRMSAQAGLG